MSTENHLALPTMSVYIHGMYERGSLPSKISGVRVLNDLDD